MSLINTGTVPIETPAMISVTDLSRAVTFVNTYDEAHRQKNWQTMNQALGMIGSPFSDWDPALIRDLVVTLLGLSGRAIEESEYFNGDSNKVLNFEAYVRWVCSLTLLKENTDLANDAADLWVITQVMTIRPPVDIEEVAAKGTRCLMGLSVTHTYLISAYKGAFISQAVRQARTGTSPMVPTSVLLQWCDDLREEPRFAIAIGDFRRSQVPERDVNIGLSSPTLASNELQTKAPSPHETLNIWSSPPIRSQEELLTATQTCLGSLSILAAGTGSPFSPLTAKQVFSRSSGRGVSNSLYFFAASDLWKCFVSTGNNSHLALARELAEVSLQLATGVHRRNALHLWMATMLPDLIPISSLPELIDEAGRLSVIEQCQPDELRLWTYVMQAHVGLCRLLESEGEHARLADLLTTNQALLHRLHQQYRQSTRHVLDQRTAEEQEAWAFLLSVLPLERESAHSLGTRSIFQEPKLERAIQEGSPAGVSALVEASLQDIKYQLQTRLDVHFSPENAVFPEGKVYIQQSQDKGQVHTTFDVGVKAIDSGDFKRAESLFRRLGAEVDGTARDLCKSYQAYALGKEGELADARRLLRGLADSRFRYHSVYWNYACWTSGDQADLQLKVLSLGMQCAPHPRLLRGLVYLALLRDDKDLLRRWLPCLTLAEALLLDFYWEYENMDVDVREESIVRLNSYRKAGEPSVPDPTVDLVTLKTANDFMNDLLERRQALAIEFWLTCRPQRAHKTLNHWIVQSDFYQRTNRIPEALQSFQREIKLRLAKIEQGRSYREFLEETRHRAEQWLMQSMTPQLREAGTDIYRMLKSFDRTNSSVGTRLAPDQKKFKDYFDTPEATVENKVPPKQGGPTLQE